MTIPATPSVGQRRDPTRIGQARPSHLITTTGVGATVDLPSMSVIVRGLDAWNPEHQDAVEERVTRTIANRLALEEGIRGLGLWLADSEANFVWMRLPDSEDGAHASLAAREAVISRGLAERGVLVRGGTSLGREGALRVTVGTEAENARFVAALAELL